MVLQYNILVHKMSDPLKVLLRFLASGKIGIWSLSRTQSEVGPGTQCGKKQEILLSLEKNFVKTSNNVDNMHVDFTINILC